MFSYYCVLCLVQLNKPGGIATKNIYFVVIQVPMVKHSNGLFLLLYMSSVFVHLFIWGVQYRYNKKKSPVIYSTQSCAKKGKSLMPFGVPLISPEATMGLFQTYWGQQKEVQCYHLAWVPHRPWERRALRARQGRQRIAAGAHW